MCMIETAMALGSALALVAMHLLTCIGVLNDYERGVAQVALTTSRSTLGQAQLNELLTERDQVNHRLQEIIDGHTEPWGVKASVVEVKDVDFPEPMKRSMARQAEAERERHAKETAGSMLMTRA